MDLARLIDHTLLKPYCTLADVEEVCREAAEYRFAAVCLPPYYVKDACKLLEGHPVKVATVIGFPMGYSAVAAKVEEIKRAVDEGADELDAVINLCAVKNGKWNYVKSEIESLSTACHMKGRLIKTIIESGVLNEDELVKIAEICAGAGVDYVKTSTGINAPGASVEVVAKLRELLPQEIKIKASGGIRDRAFAEQLVGAGASRLGSSSGIQIVSG
ncbi:MAG TPA: deoxyribose-phosphate aldolase [Bacteroidetes bacterium]|nr:deoxyribose-phosphate aldolase [Bacteroidota bacterium]